MPSSSNLRSHHQRRKGFWTIQFLVRGERIKQLGTMSFILSLNREGLDLWSPLVIVIIKVQGKSEAALAQDHMVQDNGAPVHFTY